MPNVPLAADMLNTEALEATVRRLWSDIRLYVHPDARDIVCQTLRDGIVIGFVDGVSQERGRAHSATFGR